MRSFELPFVYQEAGVRKEALVKVRVCPKCEGKLRWKPGREEQAAAVDGESDGSEVDERSGSLEEAKGGKRATGSGTRRGDMAGSERSRARSRSPRMRDSSDKKARWMAER